MIYLLLGGILFWLIAIFGIVTARFALRHEQLGPGVPPKRKPKDPHALLWWQDLQDLGLEFHLANGEIWRGRLYGWKRYPDGADDLSLLMSGIGDTLDKFRQRIEWKDPEIMLLHAHTMVDWSPLDRAYQIKLLNGSVWQFNTKSEGIGKDNEMAWHLISGPPKLRHEALVRIHKDLNRHLEHIRSQQLTRHNNLLLVKQSRALNEAVFGPLGPEVGKACRLCGAGTDLIAGEICQNCARDQVLNAGQASQET